MHRWGPKLRLLPCVVLALAPVARATAQTAVAEKQPSMYLRETTVRPVIAKHDIVLVMVVENDLASNDATLQSQRKTATELTLDKFVRFSDHHLEPDFSPQPEVDMEGIRKTTGIGRTDRREVHRMRIAARVVDVRPNGNLILEARKERRVNDERSVVTLTGEVRAKDVLGDFSVLSDRIVDLKLSYTGKGPVSSPTVWTWMAWLIDHLWPF